MKILINDPRSVNTYSFPLVMSNCAPTRKGGAETCLTMKELKDIAERYNQNHSDNINLKQNKTNLYKDIRKRLSCPVEADACILDKFNIERDTILKPKRPDGAYEWLSTLDIEDVMAQYEKRYPSFLFLGAVPIDFHIFYPSIANLNLKKTKQNKIGLILNSDPSYRSGQHWFSMVIDKRNKTICFFDSTGDKPPQQVQKLIDNLQKQGDYKVFVNKTKHQRGDNACGIYSLYFIIERIKGKTCNSIFNKVVRDKEMNKNRKEFFSNV